MLTLVVSVVQPAHRDSAMKELNAEDVLKAFQRISRKSINQKDLKCLVDALLKAINYSLIMATAEVRSIVFKFSAAFSEFLFNVIQ